MRILLSGGAGYIGAHTCVELAARGHEVEIADSLVNSSLRAVRRLEQVIGAPVPLHQVDLRDKAGLAEVFAARPFDAVLHFAALKAVGESCEKPLDYFDNNIGGTIALLQAMKTARVRHLVFSSSATVYGDPERVPVREDARLQVTNPYGRTKLVMEQLIEDLCRHDADFRAASLRYFNPVGAHASGLIGEDPSGTPNNLMPYICQVAVGRRDKLQVFGGDYPTVDGTGVRDYIHVVDPGARARRRAGIPAARGPQPDRESGHRPRGQRAAAAAGFPAGLGARNSLRNRRAPARRRGHGLRRSDIGAGAARLAGAAGCGSDVPRRLALAVDEPAGLCVELSEARTSRFCGRGFGPDAFPRTFVGAEAPPTSSKFR